MDLFFFVVVFRLWSVQNSASLAAGWSRSAEEAAVVSFRDWAGNRAPQSAHFFSAAFY